MSSSHSHIEELFSRQGQLANHFPNYQPRHAQIDMAKAVADSLHANDILVCEAGTGIGKTYAYLVPIILQFKLQQNRPQIIISTGTKNLQDQLYSRDLPRLLEVLEQTLVYCQIKGRSNYLCLAEMKRALNNPYKDKDSVALLEYVNRKHRQTLRGELSEFTQLDENSNVWKLVTSSKDKCMANECDFFDECYLYKAREMSLYADVVIVNHHLLMSDMLLKQQGKSPILPNYQACIVDEAHQIADIASSCFSKTLSSRQFKVFFSDCLKANQDEAGESEKIQQHIDLMRQHLDELNYHFNHFGNGKSWLWLSQTLQQPLAEFRKTMQSLVNFLETLRVVGKQLNHCYQRAKNLFTIMTELFSLKNEKGSICWYETGRLGFKIHQTPTNFAEYYQDILGKNKMAWIYTSATLSSLNNFKMEESNIRLLDSEQVEATCHDVDIEPYFSFFQQQLGLKKAKYMSLSSPFNYNRQMLMYQLQGLPEPAHEDFIRHLVELSLPVIRRLEGRTFFLFTSYKAMHQAYQYLSQYSFHLLLQGQLAKQKMLKQFLAKKNCILLGTYSFWEGVDVTGTALSCVIIEKLPFASPYEPVTAARLEQLRNNQCDPFYSYQIPQAIIHLKQGIGRLIRSVSDYGILIIGDRRLYSKSYGKIFRNVLPDINSTSCLDVVEQFLSNHEQGLDN